MAPESRPMPVTMEANHLLNAKLSEQGIGEVDVRPTYSLDRSANGEITVYQ